jgi:uncharacterized membrane-anchored protein
MNLDDFKALTKGVAAPAGAPSGTENLNSFIAQMRARDQQERRRLLGMALILFAVGLVFMVTGASRLTGADVVGLGMILSAAYMCLKGRWFARVDYAAPAREFLAAAAWRYRFWGTVNLPALIPLLVMALGGGLTIYHMGCRHLSDRGIWLALGGYAVFFVALCVFAVIVSVKDWRRETAALLDEIRQRQQQLENG